MPHTYAVHATEPWQAFDTLQMLHAEAAIAEAITRARSIRVDKPENGWVAEGRAPLARARLKAVAWPFWASFPTLGGEFSKDGWPNSAAIWRGGLRDLEVLTKMHAKLREFGAGHNHNRRSRVATAVECLIGAMIITPKQLAAELAITEQAQPAYYARCSSAALSGKSQGAKAFVPLALRDAVICSAACRAATATGRTRRIPRRRSRRA